MITENIDLLISRLKGEVKKNNGIADMVKWYNWTAFDVIGSLVYGESFGCLENAEYHPWLAIVLQNIKASSYVALMERYNLFKKLIMAIIPKSLMEKRNMHIGIIRDKCARRIERRSKNEKGSNPRDMISYIPDDGSMTQGEIEANLALITMAGSETSATCLAACSYFLTKNMDAARKLREEIRGAFKSEADMSYENIKPLPYLMAVMKEALRLYPPTPVGLPRRVISNGEVVCGHFIPRDVSIPKYL